VTCRRQARCCGGGDPAGPASLTVLLKGPALDGPRL